MVKLSEARESQKSDANCSDLPAELLNRARALMLAGQFAS